MILKEFKGEDLQRHLCTRLGEYWDQAENARRKQAERNIDAVRAYNAEHPVKKTFRKGRSRGNTPLALIAARTLVADRVTGLMPFPRFFRVNPKYISDEQDGELVATELLYMLEEMHFPRWLRTLVLQAALCGSSPFHLDWHSKYRTVSSPKLQGGPDLKEMAAAFAKGQLKSALAAAKDSFTGYELKHERKLIYSGPRIEPLNWFDCVQDPLPPSGQDETEWWRQMQSRRSKAQLERMGEERVYGYRVYENIDKLKWSKDMQQGDSNARDQLSQAVGLDLSATSAQAAPLIRTHMGPFDIMVDGEYRYFENVVATYVVGEDILLRFEHNTDPAGELPLQFLTWSDAGIPGTSKSEGAIPPALSTGALVTNFVNDYRDGLGKMVKGQKMVRFDSPLLDGTIEGISIEMDSVLPVNSVSEDMAPVPHDFRIPPLIDLVSRFELMYNKISGASSRNTLDQSAATATEIANVASTLAKETRESVHHLQEQIQRMVLRRLITLRYHYGPAGAQQREYEDDRGNKSWVTVPRELFSREFDVKCIGSGIVAERAQQLAGIHQFLQALPTMPPQVLRRVNFDLILDRLWALAVGRDDDEVIKPTSELEDAIEAIERARGGGGEGRQGPGANGPDLGVVNGTGLAANAARSSPALARGAGLQ